MVSLATMLLLNAAGQQVHDFMHDRTLVLDSVHAEEIMELKVRRFLSLVEPYRLHAVLKTSGGGSSPRTRQGHLRQSAQRRRSQHVAGPPPRTPRPHGLARSIPALELVGSTS